MTQAGANASLCTARRKAPKLATARLLARLESPHKTSLWEKTLPPRDGKVGCQKQDPPARRLRQRVSRSCD